MDNFFNFLLLLLLCILNCFENGVCYLSSRNDFRKTIKMSNGGIWGKWSSNYFCESNSYAIGAKFKSEKYQGKKDDTAGNTMCLICDNGETVCPNNGMNWGNWQSAKCPSNSYMIGFKTEVEGNQGNGDDTALNRIKFECDNKQNTIKTLGQTSWGPWADNFAKCPSNSRVCGIKQKVEPKQYSGDDSALNDIRLFCCDNKPEYFSQCSRETKNLLGNGWDYVRSVASSPGKWHEANDNLSGDNPAYGRSTDDDTLDRTFSIKFSNKDFNQYLLMSGDCSKYVIVSKSEVLKYTGGNGDYRYACRTSNNKNGGNILWYNRRGNPEDPWISVLDHTASPSEGAQFVYGEASNSFHTTSGEGPAFNNGFKVYIRKKNRVNTNGC